MDTSQDTQTAASQTDSPGIPPTTLHKQSCNIYVSMHKDSTTDDDRLMATDTITSKIITASPGVIPSEQPTEDADFAQAKILLPTAQLTNSLETPTTRTETDLAMEDCESATTMEYFIDYFIGKVLVFVWLLLLRLFRSDVLHGHGLVNDTRIEETRLPGPAGLRRRAPRVSSPLTTPPPTSATLTTRSQPPSPLPSDTMTTNTQHFSVYNPISRDNPIPVKPAPPIPHDPAHTRILTMTPDTPLSTPSPFTTPITTIAPGRSNPPPLQPASRNVEMIGTNPTDPYDVQYVLLHIFYRPL